MDRKWTFSQTNALNQAILAHGRQHIENVVVKDLMR